MFWWIMQMKSKLWKSRFEIFLLFFPFRIRYLHRMRFFFRVNFFPTIFQTKTKQKKKKMNSRALIKMMSSRDLLQWRPTKTPSRGENVFVVLLFHEDCKNYVKSRLASCKKYFSDGKLGYSRSLRTEIVCAMFGSRCPLWLCFGGTFSAIPNNGQK